MDEQSLILARQNVAEFPLVVSYLIPGSFDCSVVLALIRVCLPAVHSVPINTTGPPLVLTPDTLGAILTGKIDYWDAPALVALNPELQLPHLAISRVFVDAGLRESSREHLFRHLG